MTLPNTAWAIFIAVILAAPVLPQTQRGQFVGAVTDQSGSAVPGAKIEVFNPETGVKIETVSNTSGLYTVPGLNYGRYTVTVTAAGFAPYSVENAEIATATTTTLNLVLKVGNVTEKVVVTAANPVVLEATTSDIGTSVDEKLEKDAPNLISGGKRSPYSYIQLAPGVSPIGQLTIGGGRTSMTEALLDGQTLSTDSSILGAEGGGLPSVEAIGEFKLLLNSMQAEYGRSSGGEIIYATRSGTNTYHGAAYWFLRNYDLDARPWQAIKRDPLKQNEFGFAGGGPVRIPKVYNGANKTFFWANVTGYRLRNIAATSVVSVPTAAMRAGDFSAHDINPIYDVLSTTTANGNPVRQQFSYGGRQNVIDPARISKVSAYFINKMPLPNLPGSFNNFVGTASAITNNWDFSIRGDQYIGSKDRISGYYQWSNPYTLNGSFMGDTFGNVNKTSLYRPKVDWSRTISPTLVNQVIFGVSRNQLAAQSNNYGQNLGAAAGLRGLPDGNCPDIEVDRPSGILPCGGAYPASINYNTVTTLNESLLWNKGHHTIKMGMQYIHWNENSNSLGGSFSGLNYSAAGSFYFTPSTTANVDGTGGNSLASFLLGYPNSVNTASPLVLGNRETYWALFIQDDWKVTRKLTINAGLRWDLNVPFTEVHDQYTILDEKKPDPTAGNLPGALSFYGHGPGRNGIDRPGIIHWRNFGPRLGFAYQIDTKTVFRAFGGIIYQGIQNGDVIFVNRTGFQAAGAPKPNPNPFGLYYSWDTAYPQDVLGTIPNTDPGFRNGQGGFNTTGPLGIGRAPMLQMYSASLQREVRGGILLDASFINNSSKHNEDHLPINQLPPQYWSLGPLLNLPFNSPQVQALGYQAPYPGWDMTLPLYRIFLPFPQYANFTDDASNHTSSDYNAGIFKVQKRFSAGLTFLASYTISKYLTDTTWSPGSYGSTPRNFYDRALEKSLQRFDIPQRVVLSYSYELPLGRGKKLLSNANRVTNAVVSGWTFSGIQTYMAGTPASVFGALSIGLPSGITSNANRVSGVPVRSSLSCSSMVFGNQAKNYLFNAGNPTEAARTGRPLAYTPEGNYQLGNTPPTDPNARQCPTMDEDFSLTKVLTFGERVGIRFGAETFNVFNRHTWVSGQQRSDLTQPSFGEIVPFQVAGPRQIQLKLRVEF
jgi:hypothetical protein